MPLTAARFVSTIVLLLILLETVGAAVTVLPATSERSATIHTKKPTPSVLGSLLFEKAEEETDKSEEEKDSSHRVLLVDFSRVALTLSFYHTSHTAFRPLACQYNLRPPLHALNCVFLI
ncbi:MAG TPA: hypothetical protein VEB86_07315 [Chryseosolibacter sp.]|nr:hypothetical protein [Chryseosolibacter sp.]